MEQKSRFTEPCEQIGSIHVTSSTLTLTVGLCWGSFCWYFILFSTQIVATLSASTLSCISTLAVGTHSLGAHTVDTLSYSSLDCWGSFCWYSFLSYNIGSSNGNWYDRDGGQSPPPKTKTQAAGGAPYITRVQPICSQGSVNRLFLFCCC